MLLTDVDHTDPALQELLMKLRKGAVAGFNAKKTQQVLALFPGWTMVPAVMLKPSDAARSFDISAQVPHGAGRTVSLFTSRQIQDGRATTRLVATEHSQTEAELLRTEVAKFEVTVLPDPKATKAEQFFVLNLSHVEPVGADTDATKWRFSFDLYRKCTGYIITAPDGQAFEVCGPVAVLGFGGTQDFAAFFAWALANTDLEEAVNTKLGLTPYVKAAERPRVPVGGQTLGTCAICTRSQVVRHGVMVAHGYQRPGHGYLVGECFGVGYAPYEISAAACEAYIPHLEASKTSYELRLVALQQGKVTSFTETKHNWRTKVDEHVVVRVGDKRFEQLLHAEILNATQQIKYVEADIVTMRARIETWAPGSLRHSAG